MQRKILTSPAGSQASDTNWTGLGVVRVRKLRYRTRSKARTVPSRLALSTACPLRRGKEAERRSARRVSANSDGLSQAGLGSPAPPARSPGQELHCCDRRLMVGKSDEAEAVGQRPHLDLWAGRV